MLARMKATQIWQGGIRLAAILAGAQVPVAFAKAASHSATVAGIKASVDCASESVLHAAVTLGQTLWGTVDASCWSGASRGRSALGTGVALFNPVHAIVAIIGARTGRACRIVRVSHFSLAARNRGRS